MERYARVLVSSPLVALRPRLSKGDLMIPNRCYTCGKSGGHTPGCSERHAFTIPTHAPKPMPIMVHPDVPSFGGEHEIPPHIYAAHGAKTVQSGLRGHKTIGDTVLPIEGHAPTPVGCHSVIAIWPQVTMKLLRLWVDERVAPFFRIHDVVAGHTSLIPGTGGVAAAHFSMAHRDDYALATEFAVTVNVAQRVLLDVENIDPVAGPGHVFSGLFEVLTADAALKRNRCRVQGRHCGDPSCTKFHGAPAGGCRLSEGLTCAVGVACEACYPTDGGCP